MANASRDENSVPTLLGVSSADGTTPVVVYADPSTHRLLVSGGGGGGGVSTVSVVSAHGFAGTVANPTSTPAITLSTTITGILSGDGTSISAATTTGSGSVVLATSPTLVTPLLGTPTSGVLTNCTGYPVANIANLGTGVATALAVNVGSAGAFVAFNGALGTPSSGTLTNATGLPIAGLVSSTSTALGVGSLELGNASDTTLSRSSGGVLAVEGVVIPSISSTNTLTNKRITNRVLALSANSATPAINTDSYDVVHITSQTAAITSFTTNLTGTPVDGDKLRISITGTGSVALAFGASFEASGYIALPTTTNSTARLDIGFVWNTETTAWRCVSYA